MHCHTVTGSRGQPVCLQPQFIRVSSTSFVYLLPRRKSEPQFIRMCANSFVYLPSPKKIEPYWTPIHSHVFQFIRISSNFFVYFPPQKYEPQFIRISSNSFVYLLPQNISVCSAVCTSLVAQSVFRLSHSGYWDFHTVSARFLSFLCQRVRSQVARQ